MSRTLRVLFVSLSLLAGLLTLPLVAYNRRLVSLQFGLFDLPQVPVGLAVAAGFWGAWLLLALWGGAAAQGSRHRLNALRRQLRRARAQARPPGEAGE